ncbi:hypothetical protein YYE_03702 [Plasmodium vinckei vinckei]|uniref:Uncharacterized protein n=1 Tax=Plasmodium vinckei vinckei TaxID=54757 RepID=A0A081ID46_PLAVN|nr:hypothetical protein YYE_03702 [Plasmodium vinckei vinckei]
MDSHDENNLKRSMDENDGEYNDNDINESKLPEQSEKNDNIDKKKKKKETSDTHYGDSPDSSFDTSRRIGDLIMGKPLDNPIQLQLKSTNKNAKSSPEKVEIPKTEDTTTCDGKESTKKEINKTQSSTIHNNVNDKNSLKKNIVSFDDANKKIYNEKKDTTELKGEQKSMSDSFKKFDNQVEVKNRENGNYNRNNSGTLDEDEKEVEPTEPKPNGPNKIKNVNDFLAEKKNSKKITVFVGEKVQKVKADFKYGEDAPRNLNQKTVYESENTIQSCIDDSQGNENRVIEKKQTKTVFVAQRCERSNADARADARAGEKLVKKYPEKTVFEAQVCERSNADARAGDKLKEVSTGKVIYESQKCNKVITDFRATDKIKEVMKRNMLDECHNI